MMQSPGGNPWQGGPMNDAQMVIVREYAKCIVREIDPTDRITTQRIDDGDLRVIRTILMFQRDRLREKAEAAENAEERELMLTKVGSVKSVIAAIDRALERA
jgi:hypothetical protein